MKYGDTVPKSIKEFGVTGAVSPYVRSVSLKYEKELNNEFNVIEETS